MKVVAMLLRCYSYLFALILGLFMTGISLVLLISGSQNFRLDMLPYLKGDAALFGLLALGLTGVISALLAQGKRVRPLLVLFTLVAFLGVVYGYFISPVYRFSGAAGAKSAAWLALAALCAFIGSLMQFRERRRA